MGYSKYQIELLEYLKSKFIYAKIGETNGYNFSGDINDRYNEYHVFSYHDNLVSSFPDRILRKFEMGSGGELLRSEINDAPPKMASIRSSSVLFYNVFESLDYTKFNWFNHRIKSYTVEEQLTALTAKANLDGYLESDDAIIFVESKFAESYFGKGGTLSSSYLKKSNNITSEWQEFFKEFLIKNELGYPIEFTSKKDVAGKTKRYYKSVFTRYDGLQMLKHLLSIYKDIKTNKNRYKGIKEVYLVNLVWDIKGLNKRIDNINSDIQRDLTTTNILGKMESFMQAQIHKLDLSISFKLKYLNYNDFLLNHKGDFSADKYTYLINRYFN